MKTLPFIRNNLRFLAFGFMLTFVCNLGQTFFIGIFKGPIREDYGLSNGDFGALYGLATLMSASFLIWIGRLIDHVDLRYYTLVVVVVMSLACGLMYVGTTIVILGAALGLLRLTGQGLMPHISNTTMARYFEGERGRAISLAHLGINFGTLVLPLLAVFLISSFGWRESWGILGLILLFFGLPLTLLLLKGHGERHRKWEAEMTVAEIQSGAHSRMKSPLRSSILKDRRFYILLPGYLSLPLFSTAIFFFQEELLIAKGWESNLFAVSFSFFAVSTTISTFAGGFLIDKIGGSFRLLPFYGIPFAIGIMALAFATAPYMLPAMMVPIGISAGLLSVLSGTVWAEMYGTRSIGTIRAFVTALMVLGTAATPAGLGYLYDLGVTINASYIGFAIYVFIFSLVQIPLAKEKPVK